MSEIKSVAIRRNYKKQFHKSGRFSLEVNLRGFLCSCNNREKDCVRESYNLLNKYADILYPKVEDKNENTEDISDDLASEIKNLKSEQKQYRFQQLESGAKNVLFVKTTLENPVELAHKIMKEIHESKSHQTRFLIRLVPIEVTCKANMKDIERAFQPLIEKYFQNEPVSFSIVYNHRNDKGLNRDDVIKCLGEMISKTNIDHKVSLKEAEFSVIVEVIRSFVFIGVVPDFIKYKKYNLLAVGDNPEVKEINPPEKNS